MVSDLPNLIPALAYPKEIYFPRPTIAVNTEGFLRLQRCQCPRSVQSPVELSEGLTYTVISQVPYRDRTLLGKLTKVWANIAHKLP
ncbi:transglutaminase domain-containing protein [Scytonema sp. HK-05]|nr:hypothetical protein NIES2130_24200 [Scytonema sp. HK-05]BAY45566.1 transglutaminase domain-containing protein [Scytonema sp. HK-05]